MDLNGCQQRILFAQQLTKQKRNLYSQGTLRAWKNNEKNAIFFKLFWYKVFVHWELKLLNFVVDSVLNSFSKWFSKFLLVNDTSLCFNWKYNLIFLFLIQSFLISPCCYYSVALIDTFPYFSFNFKDLVIKSFSIFSSSLSISFKNSSHCFLVLSLISSLLVLFKSCSSCSKI